jgi:uncharacterized protein YoxC
LGSTGILPLAAIVAVQVSWADGLGAVSLGLIALFWLAITIGILVLVALVVRLLKRVEGLVEHLAPRAEPLIDRANQIAGDAAAVSRSVRHEIDEIGQTVQGLNRQLHAAIDTANEQVRKFGSVVRVVQDEVEEILLDATATARGLQAAADTLRRPALPSPIRGDGGDAERGERDDR